MLQQPFSQLEFSLCETSISKMKTVALLLVFGLVGFVRSADFPCPNRDVRSITFGSDNPDAR